FPICCVRCPRAVLHFPVHEQLREIPAAMVLRDRSDPQFACFAPSFKDAAAGECNTFVRKGGVGDRMICYARIFGCERECFGQLVSSGADEDGDALGVVEFAGSIASGGERGERAVRFASVRTGECARPFVVALARDEKSVGVGGGGDSGERYQDKK